VACAGQVDTRKAGKAENVDEQAPEGNPTSTHCRFCGYEEDENLAQSVREKSHIAVVVACGSCGHPFATLARN
jgi:transcription elongation factor Elf1